MRQTLTFQMTYRRLLIGLVVTVVPISILALYIVPQSRKNFEKVMGTNFQGVAVSTAAEVADFVHYTVVESGVMAADPALLEAVEAANRSYRGISEKAFRDKIRPVQQGWNTETSPAAPLLRLR